MYRELFRIDNKRDLYSNLGLIENNFGLIKKKKTNKGKSIEKISGLHARMASTFLAKGPKKFILDAQRRGLVASAFDWNKERTEEVTEMQIDAIQELDAIYATGQINEKQYNIGVTSIIKTSERAKERTIVESTKYFFNDINHLIQ